MSAQTVTSPCEIMGRWVSDDRGLEIEIDTADAKWVGQIVRSSEEDMEPGFLMLRDFSYDENEQRYKGRLVAPFGGEVSADLECIEDDVIEVTGRKLFFSRSITWRRVQESDSVTAQTTACPGFESCRASRRMAAQDPEENRWTEFAGDVIGPGALARNAAAAGVNHLFDEPETWDGEWGGFGRRVASQMGEAAVQATVEHGLAAVLNRPTRYRPCSTCRTTGQRVGYALRAMLFDSTPAGETALAVPRIAGSYASAFARAAWTPDSDARDALRWGAVSLLASAIPNLLQEFLSLGLDR